MSMTEILSRLLGRVSKKYDKKPGGLIYDALAPAAQEFEDVDKRIDEVESKLSIHNQTEEEAEQTVKEDTGLTRKPATKAVGQIQIVSGSGTINVGNLFETSDGTQFSATESKAVSDGDLVTIEAVIPGTSGNVPAETITLMPITLSGISVISNPEPTYDGFDQEPISELIDRYLEYKQSPITSGNKAHYKKWAKDVPGVGDAKIFPLWDGDNTVKVTIINSDKAPASPEIVSNVQEKIDPGSTGLGDGEAPMGSFTTVVSASGVTIDVSFDAAISSGYTLQEATENVEGSLANLLAEIAFKEGFVSYARVGGEILYSEGIQDYSNLLVNGGTTNISIGDEEVAILGTVTANAI